MNVPTHTVITIHNSFLWDKENVRRRAWGVFVCSGVGLFSAATFVWLGSVRVSVVGVQDIVMVACAHRSFACRLLLAAEDAMFSSQAATSASSGIWTSDPLGGLFLEKNMFFMKDNENNKRLSPFEGIACSEESQNIERLILNGNVLRKLAYGLL